MQLRCCSGKSTSAFVSPWLAVSRGSSGISAPRSQNQKCRVEGKRDPQQRASPGCAGAGLVLAVPGPRCLPTSCTCSLSPHVPWGSWVNPNRSSSTAEKPTVCRYPWCCGEAEKSTCPRCGVSLADAMRS